MCFKEHQTNLFKSEEGITLADAFRKNITLTSLIKGRKSIIKDALQGYQTRNGRNCLKSKKEIALEDALLKNITTTLDQRKKKCCWIHIARVPS
ncbi:hypothetical protein F8M41_013297 [Gigaspora margarita]|uniref:Uncharacterized protein n=1 Tax=Gigaspora margarita TaxID=4874 RepID=A0A8H4EUR2_GIGMA|nr:hypothetical protein F8M41_013297 [Gigaspora margarita]